MFLSGNVQTPCKCSISQIAQSWPHVINANSLKVQWGCKMKSTLFNTVSWKINKNALKNQLSHTCIRANVILVYSCMPSMLNSSINFNQKHAHYIKRWTAQINNLLYYWLSFMSHPTQNKSLWRRSSQPIYWLSTEKLNLTQQKQTCICNKIYYNTKHTYKKTKTRFGSLLRLPAGNRIGLFLRK